MSYWAVVQVQGFMLAQSMPRPGETLADVKPCNAKVALDRLGYESYLPLTKTRIVGVKAKIAPLFPGYIFARIVAGRWYPIARTVGVVRVLMCGDSPARLSDSVIAEMRRGEVRGFVKLPEPLKRGDRVRVTAGSFFGHVGLYDGQTSRQRERVLLELLGRLVPVELSRRDKVELIRA
jgi:transcriptional antiterminator RfaH